jgi:putative ABC transport system substrate-binding protein
MIQRRDFITLLGGAAAALPLAARAQQPALPVIGYVHSGALAGEEDNVRAFRRGLSDAGYVEDRNVSIEFRWAENDVDRLPELTADLIRRRVAVIATPGSQVAALAAKAATSTIPIVFSGGTDPVASGLVASLNRPGGNVTGYVQMSTELMPKRLGIMRELMPKATRFALLTNPYTPNLESMLADLQAAASTLGRKVDVQYVGTFREIDTAYTALAKSQAEAVLVGAGAPFVNRRTQLALLAAFHRLPAIYVGRNYTESGGLMSYGSDPTEQFREVGRYVGRILKGDKPADLPVVQAARFEFVINLQAARVLGLDLPPTLLALADEVIE